MEINPNNETEYIVKHNINVENVIEITVEMIEKYIKYISKEDFKSDKYFK